MLHRHAALRGAVRVIAVTTRSAGASGARPPGGGTHRGEGARHAVEQLAVGVHDGAVSRSGGGAHDLTERLAIADAEEYARIALCRQGRHQGHEITGLRRRLGPGESTRR